MDSAPDLSAPMRLVVERPDLWTVRLNGKEISPVPGEWWFDRAFGVFDLTGLLRSGDNKVTLETGTMSVFAEIEPVYLLGEFSLKPSSRGWTAVPGTTVLRKGSWKDQGYPFYSWGVVYSRDFQVSAPGDRRFSVNLRDWKGTVAQVSVNGADLHERRGPGVARTPGPRRIYSQSLFICTMSVLSLWLSPRRCWLK